MGLQSNHSTSLRFQKIKDSQETLDQLINNGILKIGLDGLTTTAEGHRACTDVLYSTPETTVAITKVRDEGFILPWHVHPAQVQYLIVIKGSMVVLFGDTNTSRVLKAKECAAVPQGVRHQLRVYENETHFVHITVPADKSILDLDPSAKLIQECIPDEPCNQPGG